MSSINYAAELYERYLRELVKDIAREYPDNSKDTLEAELEYIQKELEDKKLGFLFDSILNKHTFYQCLTSQENNASEYRSSRRYSCGVDFSLIREKYKESEDIIDIVWILQRSDAKYPGKSCERKGDRDSYIQFGRLLEEIGFTDKEKQLFYYPDKDCCSDGQADSKIFWFNALVDNGDIIYSRQGQDKESVFLNALGKSSLLEMHGKLKDMLKLCYKTQKSESIKEMDDQAVIKVAEYLSYLIPVIDENSKLKSEEQLQEERIAMRYAVLKKFLMQGKYNEEESKSEHLKNVLVKYFEDHVLMKTVVEEVCDTEKFNDEQMLVIIEEYLDLLWQDIEYLKEKVERYSFNKLCKELHDKSYPMQVHTDMWEEVCNDRGGNE